MLQSLISTVISFVRLKGKESKFYQVMFEVTSRFILAYATPKAEDEIPVDDNFSNQESPGYGEKPSYSEPTKDSYSDTSERSYP